MDEEKLTQNSILFGIMCNFPTFCGEERAKEARDYVANAFERLSEYDRQVKSGELVRVVRCKDCKSGHSHGTLGHSCSNKTLGCLHSGKKYCSEGERREV